MSCVADPFINLPGPHHRSSTCRGSSAVSTVVREGLPVYLVPVERSGCLCAGGRETRKSGKKSLSWLSGPGALHSNGLPPLTSRWDTSALDFTFVTFCPDSSTTGPGSLYQGSGTREDQTSGRGRTVTEGCVSCTGCVQRTCSVTFPLSPGEHLLSGTLYGRAGAF